MALVSRSRALFAKIRVRWEITAGGSMQPHKPCTPDWRSVNFDNTPQTWDWPAQYPPAPGDAAIYNPWLPRDDNMFATSADDIKLICEVRKNLVTNEEQLRFRAVKSNDVSLYASIGGFDGGWYYATGASAGWEHGQTLPAPDSFLSNAGWPTPPMPTDVWDNSVGQPVPMTPQQIAAWPNSWANGTIRQVGYTEPIGGRNDTQIQLIQGTLYNYWRTESDVDVYDSDYMEEDYNNPYPIAGTLLSEYCSGFDRYGTYANGSGGTYNALIAANSALCNYVAPPIPLYPLDTTVKGLLGCQITTYKAGPNWGTITPSPVPAHPTIDLTTSFFS